MDRSDILFRLASFEFVGLDYCLIAADSAECTTYKNSYLCLPLPYQIL
jgi:hypothetical protein